MTQSGRAVARRAHASAARSHRDVHSAVQGWPILHAPPGRGCCAGSPHGKVAPHLRGHIDELGSQQNGRAWHGLHGVSWTGHTYDL
eukprot:4032014-Prymnesium_polylepis.1